MSRLTRYIPALAALTLVLALTCGAVFLAVNLVTALDTEPLYAGCLEAHHCGVALGDWSWWLTDHLLIDALNVGTFAGFFLLMGLAATLASFAYENRTQPLCCWGCTRKASNPACSLHGDTPKVDYETHLTQASEDDFLAVRQAILNAGGHIASSSFTGSGYVIKARFPQ